MDIKLKKIVDEAYMACMNGVATDEQKLIWELANAVHCTRVRWMTDDIEVAREILFENDYFR